jgi:hypothetical protein
MANVATRDAALAAITTARHDVQEFAKASTPALYVDLSDFSRLLEGDASPLQQSLSAATIAEYHGSMRSGAHGLSVVFADLPRALSFGSAFYDPTYRNINDPAIGKGDRGAFINEFGWDEMMHSYLTLQYPDLPN